MSNARVQPMTDNTYTIYSVKMDTLCEPFVSLKCVIWLVLNSFPIVECFTITSYWGAQKKSIMKKTSTTHNYRKHESGLIHNKNSLKHTSNAIIFHSSSHSFNGNERKFGWKLELVFCYFASGRWLPVYSLALRFQLITNCNFKDIPFRFRLVKLTH